MCLLSRLCSNTALFRAFLIGGYLLLGFGMANSAEEMQTSIKVDDSSFKCITEMTAVRPFTMLPTVIKTANGVSKSRPDQFSAQSRPKK